MSFGTDTGCPSEEQLAGYVLRISRDDESGLVRAHLSGCATCRAWVDEAKEDEDLAGDLRRVMDADARAVEVAGSDSDASSFVAVRRQSEQPAIEGYEITQEIGRGGMGAVYLAVQKSTKRQVALKVLLDGGFASVQAKQRFEREVELAAQLHHPNIVTILDSGIASGRYYCAMQYVAGHRLNHHIEQTRPPVRERLALMGRICEAVNHAHQHGIIHRDLKPSNVIVDEQGEPHVLDFGLAKGTRDDDSAADGEPASALSMTGQVMGTLPYMSPEQTTGQHREIDIRSDVYSLGVMLYEALTGQFPYPVTGKPADVLRNIAEVDPRRPSTTGAPIDDEVETIVLKALAKDRDRRYQSAGNLADDIERYLNGQPIDAKRDSGWYVTRKLIGRYRKPVAGAVAFVAVAVALILALLTKQARLNVTEAARLLATGAEDTTAALTRYEGHGRGVRNSAASLAAEYVDSANYTERVAGARMGLWLAPDAFWESIDDGPLWRFGEWLELCEVDPGAIEDVLPQLTETARGGTPRQQYIAWCLIGRLAEAPQELADLYEQVAGTATSPGVLAAAHWAAQRLGMSVEWADSENVLVDDVSGLTFVRVNGSDAFVPGSDPSDPDRWPDEEQPNAPLRINTFWISTTEVPWSAFQSFYADPASYEYFGETTREQVIRELQTADPEQAARAAVGQVCKASADSYCDWLTRQGQGLSPARRYRLPTEYEWEYACRAGNPGRFCFGDDAKYVRYFGDCNAEPGGVIHIVGQRMPNFFGLFDMHGGLYEHTSSLFPKEYLEDTIAEGEDVYVLRGGALHSPAVRCRSAQRSFADPLRTQSYYGFRVVLEVDE